MVQNPIITYDIYGNTRPLEEKVNSISHRLPTLTLNVDASKFALGRITGQVSEFNKSLEASNARVIAFGASAGLISAAAKAFDNLVRSTIDVEKKLKDVNAILNVSSSSLARFGDTLFSIAKETGSSFGTVADAATEFARQGLKTEEVLKRTRDALILVRLANMDAVSATESLTAAVNTFNETGLDTTTILNKIVSVDAAFAVSSGDLAEAVKRTGAVAGDAKVSFDQLLAVITSAQQQTARGGAVIGNAFKSIFTRIQRPEVLKDLENIGVAIKDLEGNTLPAIQILTSLANRFDGLSSSQKSATSEILGGIFQINILKASLKDLGKEYSIYQRALETSSGATDEAIKRNERLNQTISASANQTLQTLTQVGAKVGELTLKPAMEKILGNTNNIGETLLKGFDGDSIGSRIGRGVLKGIGNVLSGPGLITGGALLLGLVERLAVFTKDAFKSIMALNPAAEKHRQIEEQVAKMLSQQRDLTTQIFNGTIKTAEAEKIVLDLLRQQSSARAQQRAFITGAASVVMKSGGYTNVSTGDLAFKTKAGGHVPHAAAVAEVTSAFQNGYRPGRVIPSPVGGVMNSAEEVKYVAGFSEPFINPPANSKAGMAHRRKALARTGIDPYQSEGYIPNFATPTVKLTDEETIVKQISRRNLGEDVNIGIKKATGKGDNLVKKAFIGRTLPIEAMEVASLIAFPQKARPQSVSIRLDDLQDTRLREFGINPEKAKGTVIKTNYVLGGLKHADANIVNSLDTNLSHALFKTASELFPSEIGTISQADTHRAFIKSLDTQGGAPQFFGRLFESVTNLAMGSSPMLKDDDTQADFDIKSITPKLSNMFDIKGYPLKKADLKYNESTNSLASMALKILRYKTPAELKGAADGYIPNFNQPTLRKAFNRFENTLSEQYSLSPMQLRAKAQKEFMLQEAKRDGLQINSVTDLANLHPDKFQTYAKKFPSLYGHPGTLPFSAGHIPNFASWYMDRDAYESPKEFDEILAALPKSASMKLVLGAAGSGKTFYSQQQTGSTPKSPTKSLLTMANLAKLGKEDEILAIREISSEPSKSLVDLITERKIKDITVIAPSEEQIVAQRANRAEHTAFGRGPNATKGAGTDAMPGTLKLKELFPKANISILSPDTKTGKYATRDFEPFTQLGSAAIARTGSYLKTTGGHFQLIKEAAAKHKREVAIMAQSVAHPLYSQPELADVLNVEARKSQLPLLPSDVVALSKLAAKDSGAVLANLSPGGEAGVGSYFRDLVSKKIFRLPKDNANITFAHGQEDDPDKIAEKLAEDKRSNELGYKTFAPSTRYVNAKGQPYKSSQAREALVSQILSGKFDKSALIDMGVSPSSVDAIVEKQVALKKRIMGVKGLIGSSKVQDILSGIASKKIKKGVGQKDLKAVLNEHMEGWEPIFAEGFTPNYANKVLTKSKITNRDDYRAKDGEDEIRVDITKSINGLKLGRNIGREGIVVKLNDGRLIPISDISRIEISNAATGGKGVKPSAVKENDLAALKSGQFSDATYKVSGNPNEGYSFLSKKEKLTDRQREKLEIAKAIYQQTGYAGRFEAMGKFGGKRFPGIDPYPTDEFINKLGSKGLVAYAFDQKVKTQLVKTPMGNIVLTNPTQLSKRDMGLFRSNIKAFAGGNVPNFSTLDDAIGREMSAGYSPSQVKVGYDSRLKGGTGIYNTTEGSLAHAINSHMSNGKTINQIQKAGLPNFATVSPTLNTSDEKVAAAAMKRAMVTMTDALSHGAITLKESTGEVKKSTGIEKKLNYIKETLKSDYESLTGKTRAKEISNLGAAAALNLDNKGEKRVSAFTQSKQFDKSFRFTGGVNNSKLEKYMQEANLNSEERAVVRSQAQGSVKEKKAQFGGRLSSAAFGVTFAAPMLAETLGIGNTRVGRGLTQVSSGLGVAGQLASTGNPIGIGAGAVVATITSIDAVMSNLTPSLEDFAKKTEKVSEAYQQQTQSMSSYLQAQESLIQATSTGASEIEKKILLLNSQQALSQITDPTIREKFVKSSGLEEMRGVMAEASRSGAAELSSSNLDTLLKGYGSEKAGLKDNALILGQSSSNITALEDYFVGGRKEAYNTRNEAINKGEEGGTGPFVYRNVSDAEKKKVAGSLISDAMLSGKFDEIASGKKENTLFGKLKEGGLGSVDTAKFAAAKNLSFENLMNFGESLGLSKERLDALSATYPIAGDLYDVLNKSAKNLKAGLEASAVQAQKVALAFSQASLTALKDRETEVSYRKNSQKYELGNIGREFQNQRLTSKFENEVSTLSPQIQANFRFKQTQEATTRDTYAKNQKVLDSAQTDLKGLFGNKEESLLRDALGSKSPELMKKYESFKGTLSSPTISEEGLKSLNAFIDEAGSVLNTKSSKEVTDLLTNIDKILNSSDNQLKRNNKILEESKKSSADEINSVIENLRRGSVIGAMENFGKIDRKPLEAGMIEYSGLVDKGNALEEERKGIEYVSGKDFRGITQYGDWKSSYSEKERTRLSEIKQELAAVNIQKEKIAASFGFNTSLTTADFEKAKTQWEEAKNNKSLSPQRLASEQVDWNNVQKIISDREGEARRNGGGVALEKYATVGKVLTSSNSFSEIERLLREEYAGSGVSAEITDDKGRRTRVGMADALASAKSKATRGSFGEFTSSMGNIQSGLTEGSTLYQAVDKFTGSREYRSALAKNKIENKEFSKGKDEGSIYQDHLIKAVGGGGQTSQAEALVKQFKEANKSLEDSTSAAAGALTRAADYVSTTLTAIKKVEAVVTNNQVLEVRISGNSQSEQNREIIEAIQAQLSDMKAAMENNSLMPRNPDKPMDSPRTYKRPDGTTMTN